MLRSFLFVPAKKHMLEKIGKLGADAYIIDLEDSIEMNQKAMALEVVEAFLVDFDSTIPIFVRLNGENYIDETRKLHRFPRIGFMLPKFECLCQYEELNEIWKKHKVIALVETPLGLINVHEIAKCEWVDILAFGAEDYTSMVNMENTTELLMYQKSRLVTYAKAYNKYVLDTPSFALSASEFFEKDVKLAVCMGFDGKLAITPKHINAINESFGSIGIDEINKIISQYERTNEAVQVINGKVYEKMHIERLKRLVEVEKY